MPLSCESLLEKGNKAKIFGRERAQYTACGQSDPNYKRYWQWETKIESLDSTSVSQEDLEALEKELDGIIADCGDLKVTVADAGEAGDSAYDNATAVGDATVDHRLPIERKAEA